MVTQGLGVAWTAQPNGFTAARNMIFEFRLRSFEIAAEALADVHLGAAA